MEKLRFWNIYICGIVSYGKNFFYGDEDGDEFEENIYIKNFNDAILIKKMYYKQGFISKTWECCLSEKTKSKYENEVIFDDLQDFKKHYKPTNYMFEPNFSLISETPKQEISELEK